MPAGNRPERLAWFRDLGFGMFIHWSHDSQLGMEISHSMVGADSDFLRRYIEELPRSFDPDRFRPREWASLARLAGMRYVVFTAKHHNGFCMFHTTSTDFGIEHTPYGRDITAEVLDAFRAEGIAVGLYFSPDDFSWLYRNGIPIQRHIPEVQPVNNPGLMALAKQQVRELLTNYGDIDLLFFDGEAEGLRDLAWELQPDVVVTRGGMETPEQHLPGAVIDGPWEANLTMGTSWPYKPTNETYKSGRDIIEYLLETRAKGGNLLLNVGPKPDGELPAPQEELLREIALWNFVNGTAVGSVRPWIVTNEQDIWFTREIGSDTVYAAVTGRHDWGYGTWKDVVLRSVRSRMDTEVSVLGQSGEILEYRPEVDPKPTWTQQPDGLHIRAMQAQRLYTNRDWPNPIVLRLKGVEPAFAPPRVRTAEVGRDGGVVVCRIEVDDLGDSATVVVGCEFQDVTGLDQAERVSAWQPAGDQECSATGPLTLSLPELPAGSYDVRAVVRHPLLTIYGNVIPLTLTD